ncbi:MAG: hypothetical protein WD795_16495 [Woeseia sp.]
MPRVPVYTEQVSTNPLHGVPVRATRSGDALQSVGAGLQAVGDATAAFAIRQQNQRNVEQTMLAETTLKDSYRDFETAAVERRGTNAWGVVGDAEKWFQQNVAEIESKLENDEQRGIFKMTASDLRKTSLDSFAKFESRERQVSVEQSTKASIAGSIDLAARHAGEPEAVAAARTDVLKRLQMLSVSNGWTPERMQTETSDTLAGMHRQVLEQLADSDPEGARAYFDANQADIAGTALDDLGRLVSTAEGRGRAQTATDEIMLQGLTQKDALAKARSYTGQERDDVVSRVKVRYNELESAKADREREVADAAWDVFGRTGKVSSIPARVLHELDGRTLQALKNAEDGGAAATDWATYAELRELALTDPERFTKLDLRHYGNKLKDSDRRGLLTLQEKLRTPENLPEAASTEKQIEVAANVLKLKKPEQKGQLQAAVYNEVAAFTRQAGREPSYDERQKIIDRLLIEGEVPGMIFDRDVSLYEVLGTEDAASFRADIPDDARREIIGALQRAGRPVTEAEIIDLWLRANEQ